MSIALPLVGVLLAALAVYFSSPDPTRKPMSRWHYGALLGLVLLACGSALLLTDNEEQTKWMMLSALLGGAFAFASGQLGSSRVSSAALGLAAGMCCHFAPDYALTNAQAMMLAVLGIGAIVTGSYAAAIAAVLVVALDSFGKMTEGSESLAFAGSLGGILLLVAAMPFICRKAPGWSVPALGGILLLIFYFVPSFLQPVAPTLLIGLVGAIVLHVLLPSDSDATPLNAGIGTIIAVGLATASYALFKGTGMAACLLGCAGVLLLMQNPRALLATGPLFGLVLFRLLRNLYPETSRAFDIGQHYALIGLLIGAILPIILIDALPVTDRAGRRQPVALFILGLVLAATAPLLTMFLGPLGIVGFVVGLGFAGIFELIRNGSSLLALSAGSGMAGVLFLTFGALEKSVDFAREEKIRLLVWAAAGILLASAAFALLTKKVKE